MDIIYHPLVWLGVVLILGIGFALASKKSDDHSGTVTRVAGTARRFASGFPATNLLGIVTISAIVATVHLSIWMTFPKFYGMLSSDPRWWPVWYVAHLTAGVLLLLAWARNRGAVSPRVGFYTRRFVISFATVLILVSVGLTFVQSGFTEDAISDSIRFVKKAWNTPEVAHAASDRHGESVDHDPYYKKRAVVAFNDAWEYVTLPDAKYVWRADRFPVYVRYDDKKFAVAKEESETVYYRFRPHRPKGRQFERLNTDELHIESHTERIGFRAPGTQPVRVTLGFSRKDLDDFSESELELPATNDQKAPQ